jgi:hypothetical protein
VCVATRKRRGGAGVDRVGQDLHLRAALTQPQNPGIGPGYTPSGRNPSIVSGLRWIPTQRSLSCLRSRELVGGQGLPAFKAARLPSRIATIWRACDLVSSRRLARPPRFPILARYSRILFCACVI